MGRNRRDRKNRPGPRRTLTPARPDGATDRLRPWLLGALSALFVARPLFPSEAPPENGDSLPVVMLWITLAVVWFLGAMGQPEFRFRFGWTDAAVGLLIGWHTIAGIRAAAYGSPRPAINALWEWVGFGLAFLLVRQLVMSRREARALIAVMVALATALAAYGLYQYFYELPRTRLEYQLNREETLREAGLRFDPGGPELGMFERRLRATEPIATFALTNSLAGLLVPWLVAAVGIAASAHFSHRRRVVLAAFTSALVIGACLLLTKSRSGYVAAILGVATVWQVCRTRRSSRGWRAPAAAGVAIVAVFGLGVASGALDWQVLTESLKSLGYRVQYWSSSLAMIADHPLFGCGPGQFQDRYTFYKLPISSEEIADPHNFFLEVWATAGTPAALALVGVLGLFLATMLRYMFRDDPRSEQGTTATDPNLSTTAEGLPPETADTDASSLILAGGACGFLLSVPLGLMSSAPPGLAAVWLGLPVASLVVTMLWTWISNRSMPVLLPAVAALALLVNLSAAGAMGFAGVAGSLWLLLALWLAATERERPHRFPRLAAFGGAGVGLVIAIACHQSAYGPVLESRAALRAAHRDPKRAEEHFREAVLADPWAAEPRKQLAETLLTRWRQERSRSVWDEFEATLQEWLRRDPNSSSAWATAGSLYLDACAVTSSRTIREQAASAYRRAVELYPTSAAYRSTLAILLREMGNEEAFREQAAEALQLHENTPHADKKLDPKLADELRKGLSRSSPEQN